jgi:hypothetical protein
MRLADRLRRHACGWMALPETLYIRTAGQKSIALEGTFSPENVHSRAIVGT